jgi:hypothetical protein
MNIDNMLVQGLGIESCFLYMCVHDLWIWVEPLFQMLPDSFKYSSQLKDLGKLWVSDVSNPTSKEDLNKSQKFVKQHECSCFTFYLCTNR